jgi:small subunit ribosomal protein S4
MGRYSGPHNKISRREGIDLFGTGGDSLRRRLEQPPGDHGTRPRRGRPSDFQRQLREKQKVKRLYGMREQQFRRFVDMARREPEMTGSALLKILERRLDNVVYKGSFARTRPMARQLVAHGHVLVNGRKVDIPSFLCEPGHVVEVDAAAQKMPDVQWAAESPATTMPSWLSREGGTVYMIDWPSREEVEFPIDDNLIVEFYSR